jgi:hypothetical protein
MLKRSKPLPKVARHDRGRTVGRSVGAKQFGDEPSREQSRAFDSPETPAPETTVVRRRRIAAKTIRLRDKEHCRFVATQPCVVCGRTPAEAHHIRFAQPRALRRKVSDEYTVPVCRVHHRDLHRYGDEAS